MLIYLILSKLLYQLMGWEKFNSIPACKDRVKFFLKKFFDEKLVFVLKVYDPTITNVDLLPNSSNHKEMLPEYLNKILSFVMIGYLLLFTLFLRLIHFFKNLFLYFRKHEHLRKVFTLSFLMIGTFFTPIFSYFPYL